MMGNVCVGYQWFIEHIFGYISDILTNTVHIKWYTMTSTKRGNQSMVNKGTEKACKQKNTRIYRELITFCTKQKEQQYKNIKRRLTYSMKLQHKLLIWPVAAEA